MDSVWHTRAIDSLWLSCQLGISHSHSIYILLSVTLKTNSVQGIIHHQLIPILSLKLLFQIIQSLWS